VIGTPSHSHPATVVIDAAAGIGARPVWLKELAPRLVSGLPEASRVLATNTAPSIPPVPPLVDTKFPCPNHEHHTLPGCIRVILQRPCHQQQAIACVAPAVHVQIPFTTIVIGRLADMPEGKLAGVVGPVTTVSALLVMSCTTASRPLGVCQFGFITPPTFTMLPVAAGGGGGGLLGVDEPR